MSADLFAEFNDSSKPSPQTSSTPSQATGSFAYPAAGSQAQNSSADFFSSFGTSNSAATPPQTQPWPTFQTQSGSINSWCPAPAQQQQSQAGDDDEGWGDFETAQPSPPPPRTSASPGFGGGWQNPAPVPAYQPSLSQQPEPRTRIIRASTIDLMTNNLVDVTQSSQPSHDIDWAPRHPKVHLKESSARQDPSVLFDADDFELQSGGDAEEDEDAEDDEFGDFETSKPTPEPRRKEVVKPMPQPARKPPVQTMPSFDLLSLDDGPLPASQSSAQPTRQTMHEKKPSIQTSGAFSFGATKAPRSQPPKSPSFQERNPYPDLSIKTPTNTKAPTSNALRSPSPVTAWPSIKDDKKIGKTKDDADAWAAWDDFPAAEEAKKDDIDKTQAPESWDWDMVDNVKPSQPKVDDSVPPPVNVPPPSVILSVFPELLNSGTSLLKPIAGQTTSIKQRVLSDPKAVDFLRGYTLLATTAARVIAGRKHRWHRDKILAKSMSISAAGSKGMKLAGVDKTQAAREDREAADVVAAWREVVGRLRSAVVAANSAGKGQALKVPELSETMQVQTAKSVPTAPKSCIICGLKREERIAKVDHDVEDSFGEWWVEHWGHRACKNFWIEHEMKLRQR